MQPEIPRKGEEKWFKLIWIRQSGELLLYFLDDMVEVKSTAIV